ncbi:FMN reductase [Arthrobacter castelli]|uniref:FMN reductase n=1 Tax=Arthrobacter castelli TaxID=271431 RepID=UPI0004265997|nr:FMN reductase [Arthrobacter castelli]
MADIKRIAVITAGLSEPSSSRMLADQLAADARRHLEDAGVQVEVDVFELRDSAVDIANNFVAGFAPPRLTAVIDTVLAADGVVAVSPIFSASYSGLFKSFFDVIENKALVGKPIILGATGGSARHSLALEYALRPLFQYLRATVTPTSVYAGPADWGNGDDTVDGLADRTDRAGSELASLILQQRPAQRSAAGDELSFEQMLAQTTS